MIGDSAEPASSSRRALLVAALPEPGHPVALMASGVAHRHQLDEHRPARGTGDGGVAVLLALATAAAVPACTSGSSGGPLPLPHCGRLAALRAATVVRRVIPLAPTEFGSS